MHPVKPHIAFPPGRWMKDTSHFNGPVTVAGASILLPAYEDAFREAFADFGLPLETIRQRAFGGEVYTQDVELTGKHDPSPPPPWWVLAIVVRLMPSLRRRMRDAEAAIAKLESYPRLWNTRWRAECEARIAEARAVDLEALDDAALVDELERVIAEVLHPHLVMHFQLTLPHMVGTYELVRCCEDSLGWDLARSMSLLTGLSSATTAATRELEGIDGPGPELDAWVERWGLRTIDADPGSPMLSERPDLILGLLRDRSRPNIEDRNLAIEQARAQLTGDALACFDRALAYAEIVYPMRDDNVIYTEGLSCGVVRRVLIAIGGRLADAGLIETADDVCFLALEELRTSTSKRALVRRRKAERAWVVANPGPLVVGPPPVADPDPRGLPAAARRLMEAIGWSVSHELTTPKPQADDASELVGTAGSPGCYTGPARVIRSEDELARLQPGDVLVCPTTHSSWTVVFGQAGALVTDGGGMLSHPAIIAREHGVPAVLATGNATSLIADGQIVTVDGGTGVVRVGTGHESAPR